MPQELRFQKAEKVPSHTTMMLMGQAANLKELSNLVRTGQMAQAVQLYQQVFKVSPQDAASAVGQMSSGQAAVVMTSQSYPMMAGPYGASHGYITSQPIVTVTSTTVNTRGQRTVMWAIGCFVAFIIITTVLPAIIGVVAAVAAPILAVVLELLAR